MNNEEEVKYDFSLWSYYGKFNFKRNKKELINQNNLKDISILSTIVLKVLIIVLINV